MWIFLFSFCFLWFNIPRWMKWEVHSGLVLVGVGLRRCWHRSFNAKVRCLLLTPRGSKRSFSSSRKRQKIIFSLSFVFHKPIDNCCLPHWGQSSPFQPIHSPAVFLWKQACPNNLGSLYLLIKIIKVQVPRFWIYVFVVCFCIRILLWSQAGF